MVQRFGSRKMLFFGSILLAGGLLSLSRIDSLLTFYLSFALMGLGVTSCSEVVFITAVAHWFRRRIGLASGLALAGFGVSGLLVPLVVWLIDAYEWRMALLIIGGGVLCVILPMAFVLRNHPEPYGYLPDGDTAPPPAKEKSPRTPAPMTQPVSLRQAVRSRALWHITLGLGRCWRSPPSAPMSCPT